MAEFGFTKEQEEFRGEMRRFAQTTLKPGATQRNASQGLSPSMLGALAEAGLLGLGLSPVYGGRVADTVTIGIAVEELGKVDFFASLQVSAAAGIIVDVFGSDELKREWLPRLVTGKALINLALTESLCGTDAAAIRTRAVRDGDDYVIDGEKIYVSSGWQSEANLIIAKTNPEARARGTTCFLVPLDAPGLTVAKYVDAGHKPQGRAVLTFDGVRCPAKNVVGGEGRGFYGVMAFFDYMRARLGLTVLGAAQGTLVETVDVLRDRAQAGGPRAGLEVMRVKVAEHATRIEAARLVCYLALWRKDQGLPHAKEASMAKWLGPRVAADAIRDLMLMRGFAGQSEDLPNAQRLMDVVGLEIGDGTAEAQKIVISREIFGRQFRAC